MDSTRENSLHKTQPAFSINMQTRLQIKVMILEILHHRSVQLSGCKDAPLVTKVIIKSWVSQVANCVTQSPQLSTLNERKFSRRRDLSTTKVFQSRKEPPSRLIIHCPRLQVRHLVSIYRRLSSLAISMISNIQTCLRIWIAQITSIAHVQLSHSTIELLPPERMS